jgi:hypothetical protein
MNSRGEYGNRFFCDVSFNRGTYGALRVGEGSVFGHTPGDVEDELNQLHGEIMAFGQQFLELAKPIEDRVKREFDAMFKQEQAATEALRQQMDLFPDPKDPKRKEAVERYMAWFRAPSKVHALYDKRLGEFPLIHWGRTAWGPFFHSWSKFYHEKKDIPLQSWPLSGTWDRIQDYRQQFIDLRKKAPFEATGPTPLDPRKDPTITGAFGELGKIFKYVLIGGLAIGGAVAISSVVANLKKGRDPVEHYVGLYRGRKGLPA